MTIPLIFRDQAGNELGWTAVAGRNPIRMNFAMNTAEIELSQGLFCTIDAIDLDKVKGIQWYANGHSRETAYAVGHSYRDGKRIKIRMHQLIAPSEPGHVVDHINGNRMDNRRENLREATSRENSQNRKAERFSVSKFKGVFFAQDKPRSKPWYAEIRENGRRHFLGCFETEESAAHAYDDAAKKMHGQFARLNFEHEVAP